MGIDDPAHRQVRRLREGRGAVLGGARQVPLRAKPPEHLRALRMRPDNPPGNEPLFYLFERTRNYLSAFARNSPRSRISPVWDSPWGRKAIATKMFSMPSETTRLR